MCCQPPLLQRIDLAYPSAIGPISLLAKEEMNSLTKAHSSQSSACYQLEKMFVHQLHYRTRHILLHSKRQIVFCRSKRRSQGAGCWAAANLLAIWKEGGDGAADACAAVTKEKAV